MITTVLFDLDGTLLPMNNDEFVEYYFKFLCARMANLGFDPKEVVDAVWAGTAAMVKNDGSVTNETAFWKRFQELMGDKVIDARPELEDFYANEFNKAKAVCGQDQVLIDLVARLKDKGYRVILATNPIFPKLATQNRIGWAGLKPEDFELYTTYEDIGYSKPNPEYYSEVLRRINAKPEECIMIGNDATEDMVAESLGIKVFLLTDNLINKNNVDIDKYPHGSSKDLVEFLGV